MTTVLELSPRVLPMIIVRNLLMYWRRCLQLHLQLSINDNYSICLIVSYAYFALSWFTLPIICLDRMLKERLIIPIKYSIY